MGPRGGAHEDRHPEDAASLKRAADTMDPILSLNREIEDARSRISAKVHKTPLVYSSSFSTMFDAEVFIKAENLQKTGSFKARGALNKILKSSFGKVAAASMGNHAQGVAYAASVLGIPAKIVMPRAASPVKIEATRGYGAEVILHGNTLAEALAHARSYADYEFIHPFDDEDIMAGQGTIGVEILEELDRIDDILVPVGGGGLISGISAAVKVRSAGTAVIGVQALSATSALESLATGEILEVPPQATIADGIAVSRVGEKPFRVMTKAVARITSVREESIAAAMLLYLERKKLVVEGAGAVGLAALLEEREKYRGRRVVLVASGGNIDFTLVDRIIHQGLTASGRLARIDVTVQDFVADLRRISGILMEKGGRVVTVNCDTIPVENGRQEVVLSISVETRGEEHIRSLLAGIEGAGYSIRRGLVTP